jgi:hypothetical protein
MKIGMVVTAGFGIVLVGLLGFLLRPVCMPLGQENLASFHIPAKQRMEQRDLYLKVWQEKGGRWYHCKTYLSRLLT